VSSEQEAGAVGSSSWQEQLAGAVGRSSWQEQLAVAVGSQQLAIGKKKQNQYAKTKKKEPTIKKQEFI
jgi:hypothetical protein